MNDIIYFDNCATTFPKPPSVIEECAKCMREYCGNPGRGSHRLAVAASEKLFECREFASNMFGAKAENVTFTYNTTYAINMAIKSFVPKGSHVLISDLEHNAVLRPVEEMKKRGEITYDVFHTLSDAKTVCRGILNLIRQDTRAIICTLASNVCSANIPFGMIGKLCAERGVLFIADGAQAAGHRRINMADERIDVLCIPGHKGLYGPQGIGMMICREGLDGRTFIEGGSGSDSEDRFMPEFLPDRYEAGTANTPGAAGLLAGMRFVSEMGFENIQKHESELWYRLYSRLCDDRRFILYGTRNPSSVVLLNRRGISPSEVASILADKGICVRSGLHCAPLAHKTIGTGEDGGVRVSFGLFNTVEEVDVLCRELRKM